MNSYNSHNSPRNNSKMPIVFTIDGTIGAGKSSVLEYLNKTYNVPVIVEPIAKWQPYLNDLYGNKESSAFNFQTRVWLDRCWIDPLSTKTVVMERSPFFQESVFVKINCINGRITEKQSAMLKEMYDKTNKLWCPSGYIYLRSAPEKCLERIAKRARNSEDAIPITYMNQLNALHEEAYHEAANNGKNIICIDVDGKTIAEVATEAWTALKTLGTYIDTKVF